MNGLYGYPMSGAAMSGLLDMPVNAIKTFNAIRSGAVAKDLATKRRKLNEQTGNIQRIRQAIAGMREGPGKSNAGTLLDRANSEHRTNLNQMYDAVAKYDELVNNIRTYSFGAIQPPYVQPGLAGLAIPAVAALPAVIAIAPAAAGVSLPIIIAVGAVALIAFGAVLLAVENAIKGTDSLLGQANRALGKLGTIIPEIPKAITATTWLLVAAVGSFFAYQLFQERRGGRARTATGAVDLDLKEVGGEVVA